MTAFNVSSISSLSTTTHEDFSNTTDTVVVSTERPEWIVILDYTSKILMTCNVITLMLAMGAATYWREIWHHVKRPWGCLFGMICQFFIFPAMGFGLCLGFQLPTYEALGVLILVCSPGGAFSNFFTYWVDGDLALSILMTALSSLVAFGMMPFNLWVYSKLWTEQTMQVPYINVLISLAFVTVPVIVGMIIRHCKRKWATYVSKVCGLLGWIGATTCGILLFIIYWSNIIETSLNLIIIAALVPLLGAIVAYIVSKIICFSHSTSRTIAIETGSQNMVVATNVMMLSFSEPDVRGKMVIFPVIYGLFLLIEVAIVIGIYQLWSYFHQERVIEKEVRSKIDNSLLTSVPVPAHRLSQSTIQRMTGFPVTPDLCRLQQDIEEQQQREMDVTTYHRYSDSPRQQFDDLHLEENEPFLQHNARSIEGEVKVAKSRQQGKSTEAQKCSTTAGSPLVAEDPRSPLPLYARPQSPVYFKFPQNFQSRSPGSNNDSDSIDFFDQPYKFEPCHNPVSPTLSNKGVPNMFPVTEDDFEAIHKEDSPLPLPYGSPIPIPKEKRLESNWNQQGMDHHPSSRGPASPIPIAPGSPPDSSKTFGFYHNDLRIGQTDQFSTFGREK